MWAKTPWMVRAFGMALILFVVIVIIARVSQALSSSKPHSYPTETILEQKDQIPLREVYGRVDAIIRQALASMQESINAQQRGNQLGASVFAMQAFAYLQSAFKIAPKRTVEIVPDVQQRIQDLRTLCASNNINLPMIE